MVMKPSVTTKFKVSFSFFNRLQKTMYYQSYNKFRLFHVKLRVSFRQMREKS